MWEEGCVCGVDVGVGGCELLFGLMDVGLVG